MFSEHCPEKVRGIFVIYFRYLSDGSTPTVIILCAGGSAQKAVVSVTHTSDSGSNRE